MNISSVAGRVAPAGFAAYAATKWGINGHDHARAQVAAHMRAYPPTETLTFGWSSASTRSSHSP